MKIHSEARAWSIHFHPSLRPRILNFGAAGFLPFGGGGVYFVDPHLRTPYTIQFNLGVQRSLGQGVTAEAGPTSEASPASTRALTDTNPFILGSGTDRLYDTANGGLGNYSYLNTFKNITSESYSSLQSSLRKQTSSSPYVGNHPTSSCPTPYAKNMDNVSGFRQRNAEVPFYNPSQLLLPSRIWT